MLVNSRGSEEARRPERGDTTWRGYDVEEKAKERERRKGERMRETEEHDKGEMGKGKKKGKKEFKKGI